MISLPYGIPEGEPIRLQWHRERIQSAAAAVNVSPSWTNNVGLPFLCLHAGGVLTPGAAQIAIQGSVHIQDFDATLATCVFAGDVIVGGAANQIVRFGGLTHFVVPPRWRITGRGDFNAGAAANTVGLDIYGFFIPRGNLSLP